MGLTVALNTALTGLNVNQQSLAVLSQNIANANTPGYSKQSVNQQAIYIEGSGAGVSIKDITRSVDQYLVGAVQTQNSAVGQANVTNDYNQRTQLLMGQPGNSNSIDSYTNDFFNALQSLAQTPSDSTLQQQAVGQGVTLANQVQSLATGLQGLQFQADQDMGNAVTAANNDLQQLGQLNAAIANANSLGNPVGGLEDQQNSVLNDLSKYIDIKTFNRSNGTINITTGSGVSLLDDNLHQLSYSPVSSPSAFSTGGAISPLTVTAVDSQSLAPIGAPVTLIAGGTQAAGTSMIGSGQIAALVTMRDQQIPALMAQLDQLASTVTDQVNAIHNSGSGYPGANSYTGTTLTNGQDITQWSGSVRVAVLDKNGQPIPSSYTNQPGGVPPLNLDLSSMNSGSGQGKPSVQSIIDAINQYYGPRQNKVQVGSLDNIQLASDSALLPGNPGQFSFDFNLSNLSAGNSKFFVTGVQVKDDQGSDITALTSNVPKIALDPAHTYVTTPGSNTVTINTTKPSGLRDGDTVYLSTPNSVPSIDGIPSSKFGGYFTATNVTATSFQIAVADAAHTGMISGVAGQTAEPPYSQVVAGTTTRTNANGVITTNLSNTLSQYYTVNVNVGVQNADGTINTSTVSYRVTNGNTSALNSMYQATAATADGNIIRPTSNAPIATAMLVDANGNELPKINGKYSTSQQGYLVIKASNGANSMAIDSMDSTQLGLPDSHPPIPGTNKGFSYYFGLNNFFQPNTSSATSTVKGSALNMAVESRLQDNPQLLSLGSLVPTAGSNNPTNPTYTYARNVGDNSIIQKLATLGVGNVAFGAAGGQGATSATFAGYAGGIVGGAATQASNATALKTSAQNLLDGFTQRAATISGVNLDAELANTVIYQNAYAASARVITVTSTLFDTLLQAFR